MSIESAKAYIERMKTDKEFANRFNECKDVEACVVFVKTAGYEFTAKEIKQAIGVLSDNDLDKVTGGDGVFLPPRPSSAVGGGGYGIDTTVYPYLVFGLALE